MSELFLSQPLSLGLLLFDRRILLEFVIRLIVGFGTVFEQYLPSIILLPLELLVIQKGTFLQNTLAS